MANQDSRFFGYDDGGMPINGEFIPNSTGLGLELDGEHQWFGVNVDNSSPQGPADGHLAVYYGDDVCDVSKKDLRLFAESLLKFLDETEEVA